jgi:hypothetical protein
VNVDPTRPSYSQALAGGAGRAMRVYAWAGTLALTFLFALAILTTLGARP